MVGGRRDSSVSPMATGTTINPQTAQEKSFGCGDVGDRLRRFRQGKTTGYEGTHAGRVHPEPVTLLTKTLSRVWKIVQGGRFPNANRGQLLPPAARVSLAAIATSCAFYLFFARIG